MPNGFLDHCLVLVAVSNAESVVLDLGDAAAAIHAQSGLDRGQWIDNDVLFTILV